MATIAFIVPPNYAVPHAQFNLERVGLGYLAAPLREAGYHVVILDGIIGRMSWDEIISQTVSCQPLLIGISLMSHDDFLEFKEELAKTRQLLPKSHICLGGTFPSLNWKALLNRLVEIDSIVCGDGDKTIVELADSLKNGLSYNKIPGVAINKDGTPRLSYSRTDWKLDQLPFPSRDQLHDVISSGGPASILTSRGCYGRCNFCALHAISRSLDSRRVRYRSATNVTDEMETLYRHNGAKRFYFLDENFIGPGRRGRKRARDIAREIKRREMKISFSLECRCGDVEEKTFQELSTAGLQRVFLGVESTDQAELDTLRKDQSVAIIFQALDILKRLKIHVEIGFILFTPWSTLKSLANKRQFLEEFGPHATASLGSYLSIVPGTELEGSLRASGLVRGEWPSYRFEFQDRRASILFGLVQRELVSPWNETLQKLLNRQWSQENDWSIKHSLMRDENPALQFVDDLLQWAANKRLHHFDALFDVVAKLSLPEDVDTPPSWALDSLNEIATNSRRHAAETTALLMSLDDWEDSQKEFAAEV